MDKRELLIKLILQSEILASEVGFFNCHFSKPKAECVADFLLENGVNLPPCKVGDTVYQTDGERVYASVVKKVIYDTDGIAFDETAIGTSVFTRREQAEVKAALNKLESENN